MVARGLPDENIKSLNIKENDDREVLLGVDHTNKLFSKALGVLPDNNVKLFIGVEGKHDISFLQNISKTLIREGEDVPDLGKLEFDGDIIFFPCGGTNLALWTSRLENLNRPEFHLVDRDTPPPKEPKYKDHIDEVNKRGDQYRGKITCKKEMENYLHKDAIIEGYRENNIELSIDSNFEDFDDVPAKIAQLVHEGSGSEKSWGELLDDEKGKKISKAKNILNSIAVNHMNKRRLQEIDPSNELLGWFADIKELMRK